MSSSSVCQGLQSCLEPRLIEPHVLNLKLAPTRSNSNLSPSPEFSSFRRSSSSSFFSILESDQNVKESKSGWSFLQSSENNVYVHPSFKLSSSKFSAESLELCTESLGCETGSSNAVDNGTDHDMSLFSSESNSSYAVKRNSESKKLNRVSSNFPPPLTSMAEFGGFQVRSHREDGRLILEALTSSSPKPYFQAERENGRLRLRLFKSVSSCCCDDGDGEACVEEEAEVVEVLDDNVWCGGEDETEMTNFTRPSRCKESGSRDIFGDGYFELPSLSLCL
ncbi:protein FANTASTIC FOUR 2-like [Lotus japonicus]|uniref:protein FANTASTIC FOUR 2-like n=1 Tax=Lotus japonicus TaxID=34305 RepID=UPI002589540A|nr:protein FANTASTIC FOUR 2-like [Lotus japonicus]